MSKARSSRVKTNRYLISGKVQGVGFRRFVQTQAAALGVRGWTRNLFDDRVEVYAQGAPEQIHLFSEKLSRGPAFSVVENVVVSEIEFEAMTGFEIKPDGDAR